MKEYRKVVGKPWLGHITILIVNIIFGTNASFSKILLNGQVSSNALTLFRFLGSATLFWIASLFIKREKIPWKDLLLLFVAAIFGIIFNQGLFVAGLSKTSPIDAVLLVTLTPVMTMLIAAIHLKEPITIKKAVGVIIGCCGAVLLILQSKHYQSGTGNWIGNIMILISDLSYAIYLAVFVNLVRKYSPITVMKWMFLFGSIVAIPLWGKDALATPFSEFTIQTWEALFFVVAIATFLAYLLIPIAQKRIRPTTLSMYNYFQPAIATLVATILGLDHFGWDKVVCTALIFCGVYIVTQSKSRHQMEEKKRTDLPQNKAD